MNYKPLLKIAFLLAFCLLLFACAKQVAITGGPKDITPPKLVESTPPNGSTNFTEEIIYVKFDEYVKLNSLNQKLIVSPPIEEEPDITIKGKGVKIVLDPSKLERNTTYSLNFNDAIADNNENNSLNSFVYAFSTGDQIDSLSFSGYVLDAFTKMPIEDAWVILHDVLNDTAIQTLPPAYITKVDKSGKFLIPFVRENDYRIYAITDNNYNYMFDIPEEGIAFLDTVFTPKVEKATTIDSAGNETSSFENKPSNIELLLFSESKQPQFIKSEKRVKPNYLEIIFNGTQYEEFSVKVADGENSIIYSNEQPDTVQIWLKEENLINSDSVIVFIDYRDPIFTDTLRNDTLYFTNTDAAESDTLVELTINTSKEPHKDLVIVSSSPAEDIDLNKIKLEVIKDTIFSAVDFEIIRDSLNPIKLKVKSEFIEQSDYRLIYEDGFIKDINGLENIGDTVEITVLSSSEYGNLLLNFIDADKSYILQLMVGDKIIREEYSKNGVVEFSFIKPDSYKMRAIEDINDNKRWDAGDYSKRLQAEPVYYYPEEYEIRSNWNHDIEWNPETNISK